MSLSVSIFKILWIYLFTIFIICFCTKTEAPKMSLSSVIDEQYLGESHSISVEWVNDLQLKNRRETDTWVIVCIFLIVCILNGMLEQLY